MNKEVRLCKDCQNFLHFADNDIQCDYDQFAKSKIEDAIIFVPEQFECEFYEKHA